MQSKQLSLVHLVQYPASYSPAGEGIFPTIVALHGRGSNERDLIGLAPYLPQELLWISPRGAFSLGPDAYEWFQLMQVGRPDPTRLANSLDMLDRFLEEVKQHYPVDAEKLYLLGFSQGTVVSLSYAVSMPERVVGVIAQSAYLPLESGLQIDDVGLRNKPILLTHGIHDPVLPVDWARRSRDKLQELGANVEYHEFNMGHEVTPQSLQVIAAWLEHQLAT
jgi:phospholipase/carboxylesterase